MALNTPYKRINPNSINYAAMGQKDPWFALGYALGEGYWNNYNARGEAKATETTKQGLDNFLKYGNVDGPVLGDDEMLSKYARPDKKQQAIDAAVQLPELKPLSKGKDGENKGGGTTGQPTFDHALLKWGYTQDKYKDSPNPVGDSIAAQKLLNGTEIALNSTDMGAFNEDAFKLAIMDKLTKEGRTPQQREAAWAAIQPMIANKKAEYNSKVVNDLYGLYEQANLNQDYATSRSLAMQISRLDPTLGKSLLSGTVSPKDIWEQQNKERMLNIRLSGKGGKNSERNVINSTSKAELEHAYKVLENPDAYGQQAVDAANKIVQRVSKWGNAGLDLDDEVAVSRYISDIKKRVDSGEINELEAYDEMYKDGFVQRHPYAEDLLKRAGLYYRQQWDEKGNAYTTFDNESVDTAYDASEIPVFGGIQTPEGKSKTLVSFLDEATKDEKVDARGRKGIAKHLG